MEYDVFDFDIKINRGDSQKATPDDLSNIQNVTRDNYVANIQNGMDEFEEAQVITREQEAEALSEAYSYIVY